MCQTARNAETGYEIHVIGHLKDLTGGNVIERRPGEYGDLTDDLCLCPVDLPATLIEAGFKVWRNPDAVPEYLFEPLRR